MVAKDGMRVVDKAVNVVFRTSKGGVGKVGGEETKEEGEASPARGSGKSKELFCSILTILNFYFPIFLICIAFGRV